MGYVERRVAEDDIVEVDAHDALTLALEPAEVTAEGNWILEKSTPASTVIQYDGSWAYLAEQSVDAHVERDRSVDPTESPCLKLRIQGGQTLNLHGHNPADLRSLPPKNRKRGIFGLEQQCRGQ